ncbi:hypothetical protein AOR10_24395, partial [Vibrio alginolyticus]
RRDPAEDGIGQHRDVRHAGLLQFLQRRRGLGHLHQRKQRFLHARPAGGGEADQRNTLLQGHGGGAHELLAHHRTHGATHEGELEGHRDHRQAIQGAAHGDQRILLAGLLLGRGQAVLILLRVTELEAVNGLDLGGKLLAALTVEEPVEALAGGQTQVVIALGADVVLLLEFGQVEHRLALGTLAPQAVGHACAAVVALDTP